MLTMLKTRSFRTTLVLAALALIAALLAACGSFEVGIELTPTPEPTSAPQPAIYTNSDYGFRFEYPASWELEELPNQVSLRNNYNRLVINFWKRDQPANPAVVSYNMPAGNLIYRGKLAFIDQVIPLYVLVYESKDKAVYYGDSPVEAGGLNFLLRLEDNASIPYEEVELSQAAQEQAVSILESVQLTGQPVATGQPGGSQDTPQPSPVAGQPGSLGGQVCYPSERIPPMTAFFQNLDTGELVSMAIDENQTSYEIGLGAGEYQVYAYLDDSPMMGGGYTQAVICGLTADCSDHSLLPVPVRAGQATRGIDLCDWYDASGLPANPNATEPADPAAAGLVYYHPAKGLWQVETDGLAHWLFPYPDVEAISPDGQQALVVRNDDIWLADRHFGTLKNLTNTPDRLEMTPQFWPANPGVIVFGSIGVDEERGLSNGRLTRMNLDGSGYQVLEPDANSIGPASLSPDGQTIAYETADQAWLYRDDTGKTLFDVSAYGLTGVKRVISPSWSPDGSKIAWWIGGQLNGAAEYSLALAVFDLDNGGVSLLHPYTPIGGDGWPVSPAWDSSGQWLVTLTISEAGTKGNLWALKADGGDEVNLGNGAYPVWDPQGNGLIYVEWGGGSFEDSTDKLTHSDNWTLTDLQMQPGSMPFAWLTP